MPPEPVRLHRRIGYYRAGTKLPCKVKRPLPLPLLHRHVNGGERFLHFLKPRAVCSSYRDTLRPYINLEKTDGKAQHSGNQRASRLMNYPSAWPFPSEDSQLSCWN